MGENPQESFRKFVGVRWNSDVFLRIRVIQSDHFKYRGVRIVPIQSWMLEILLQELLTKYTSYYELL